jgi:hypothetical protein
MIHEHSLGTREAIAGTDFRRRRALGSQFFGLGVIRQFGRSQASEWRAKRPEHEFARGKTLMNAPRRWTYTYQSVRAALLD